VPQLRSGRLATQQHTRQKIYKKKKKGEGEKTPRWNSKGSYSPNLPLIEEAPGHEPSSLRIKKIEHINN
jgi:hypothetical protein